MITPEAEKNETSVKLTKDKKWPHFLFYLTWFIRRSFLTMFFHCLESLHCISICICLRSPFQTFYFISFLLVIVYAWKSKNVIRGWRESATDDEDRQVRQTRVHPPFKNLHDSVVPCLNLFILVSESMQKENYRDTFICHCVVSLSDQYF